MQAANTPLTLLMPQLIMQLLYRRELQRLSTEILESEYGALCNRVQNLTIQSLRDRAASQPSSSALNSSPVTDMDFHNQSLDAYEAQLDQQIEVNNGVTLCVLHTRKTALSAGLPAASMPTSSGSNDRGPA